MKKNTNSRFYQLFSILLVIITLISINSCIKGNKQIIFPNNISGTVTDILLSRMADKDKVHSVEINTWLNANFPAANLPILQMDKAQQNVIAGQHVIRIPIAANAALFFTKNKGELQSYLYKWADKAPGQKQFTGTVFSYEFKTNTIQQINYDHSVAALTNYFAPPTAQKSMMNNKLKVNDNSGNYDGFFLFFEKFICWLRGGRYITQEMLDNHESDGANGEILATGCDMSWAGGGGQAEGESSPSVPPGFFGSPNITATNLGASGSNNAGYGNGYVWLSTYIPPSGGCIPGAGDGLPQEDPGSGDCVLGHWVNFLTAVPLDELNTGDSMSINDGDADDDNNADGNFDNATYDEYQQTTPWPSVTNVLSNVSFVPFNHTNCLTLSKQQISPAGYSISNYGAAGQTIQAYTEAAGANQSNVKKAITYINSQLAIGAPVIVGVDVKSGQTSPPYTDNSTDHFVVIVGSGIDSGGNYYRFYDNSTDNSVYGTSVNNKLYYNSTTGIISGNTHTLYDSPTTQLSHPSMHPYIVTQIRKNKS